MTRAAGNITRTIYAHDGIEDGIRVATHRSRSDYRHPRVPRTAYARIHERHRPRAAIRRRYDSGGLEHPGAVNAAVVKDETGAYFVYIKNKNWVGRKVGDVYEIAATSPADVWTGTFTDNYVNWRRPRDGKTVTWARMSAPSDDLRGVWRHPTERPILVAAEPDGTYGAYQQVQAFFVHKGGAEYDFTGVSGKTSAATLSTSAETITFPELSVQWARLAEASPIKSPSALRRDDPGWPHTKGAPSFLSRPCRPRSH